MPDREVLVGEFRHGMREILDAFDESSRSWGTSLSNWIVTVASALLAVPVIASGNLAFRSKWLWFAFVLADAAFLACIVLVIVRTQLFLRRLDEKGAHMAEIQEAIAHLPDSAPMPPPRPEWVKALDETVEHRKQERLMDYAALYCFLAGILLLTLVLLVQTYPGSTEKPWSGCVPLF